MLVMLFKNTYCQPIKKIKIKALNDLIATSDSVLIINFWTTFCKPCVDQIPNFKIFKKR